MVVLAIFLAAINQVFSLLDPQIFRIIVDKYASHIDTIPAGRVHPAGWRS